MEEKFTAKTLKCGFIGAGNMAWAVFQKLKKSGLPAKNFIASAPSRRNLRKWEDAGTASTHDNGEIIKKSDIVFLALKPQQFQAEDKEWCCTEEDIASVLFISVIAGIPISNLQNRLKWITKRSCLPKVIRVGVNMPLSVGFGCTVISKNDPALSNDFEIVKKMLSGDGCLAEEVPESMMDAAGVVVGCGPAYMYLMLEAMADGAVKQGIPRHLATPLVAQTMLGAAQMVLQTGKHPGLLKDEVCSPAGTTIAGLHALQKAPNFSSAVMDAIEAATIRSKQLTQTTPK